MSNTAIRVEGLGKRYTLGEQQAHYKTLRESLAMRFSGSKERKQEHSTLWALRDVSFSVPEGSALGIIGANGAGKSTLLKILSRITEPTEGRGAIRGRVGSLLEVGTGFHPELTGRENIFLNASILGMRRNEILKRFDAIVAFAEVDRFLDTPVKRYSSGMYVRLAFAVAAHLDLEVLLVDEVLAVGDVSFQRKCLNKMEEISEGRGRTVCFVSHNLAAVSHLTRQCLWIDRGTVKDFGPTGEVVRGYLKSQGGSSGGGVVDLQDLRRGRPRKTLSKALEFKFRFIEARLVHPQGNATGEFLEGEPMRLELTIEAAAVAPALEILCKVRTLEGVIVFTCMTGPRPAPQTPGRYRISCAIDPNPLRPGRYQLELFMVTGIGQDLVPNAMNFDIVGHLQQDDNSRYARDSQLGVIRVQYPWSSYEPLKELPHAVFEPVVEV